jgi:hypothetical protein
MLNQIQEKKSFLFVGKGPNFQIQSMFQNLKCKPTYTIFLLKIFTSSILGITQPNLPQAENMRKNCQGHENKLSKIKSYF